MRTFWSGHSGPVAEGVAGRVTEGAVGRCVLGGVGADDGVLVVAVVQGGADGSHPTTRRIRFMK
jgi:hypothetical protein